MFRNWYGKKKKKKIYNPQTYSSILCVVFVQIVLRFCSDVCTPAEGMKVLAAHLCITLVFVREEKKNITAVDSDQCVGLMEQYMLCF